MSHSIWAEFFAYNFTVHYVRLPAKLYTSLSSRDVSESEALYNESPTQYVHRLCLVLVHPDLPYTSRQYGTVTWASESFYGLHFT